MSPEGPGLRRWLLMPSGRLLLSSEMGFGLVWLGFVFDGECFHVEF